MFIAVLGYFTSYSQTPKQNYNYIACCGLNLSFYMLLKQLVKKLTEMLGTVLVGLKTNFTDTGLTNMTLIFIALIYQILHLYWNVQLLNENMLFQAYQAYQAFLGLYRLKEVSCFGMHLCKCYIRSLGQQCYTWKVSF